MPLAAFRDLALPTNSLMAEAMLLATFDFSSSIVCHYSDAVIG